MLRLAPPERRAWAEAMLCELDYVEQDGKHGDWAALFWALGCSGAILRECLLAWIAWVLKRCAELLGIRQKE